MLSKLNVEKDNAVYVGDSDVDFATSVNAGMDVIRSAGVSEMRNFFVKGSKEDYKPAVRDT